MNKNYTKDVGFLTANYEGRPIYYGQLDAYGNQSLWIFSQNQMGANIACPDDMAPYPIDPQKPYEHQCKSCFSPEVLNYNMTSGRCLVTLQNNPGKFDALINDYCSGDMKQQDICSCSEQGLAYQFGAADNVPTQILLNPACTYSKCALGGYKTAGQIRTSGNCPNIQVCDLKMDLSKIQDGAIVSNIQQKCTITADKHDGTEAPQQEQLSQVQVQQTQTSMQQSSAISDMIDLISTYLSETTVQIFLLLFSIVVIGLLIYWRYKKEGQSDKFIATIQ